MKFLKYTWNLCYATGKKIGVAFFHLVFITLFCTLPHELRHAMAANCFSYRVDYISINFFSTTERWFSFKLFKYEIRLGRMPLIGGSTHYGYGSYTRNNWAKSLIITAAGLLVNLLLALLAWWAEKKTENKFWKNFFRLVKEYNFLTIIYNFVVVLWKPNCDVRKIFSLLFRKNNL